MTGLDDDEGDDEAEDVRLTIIECRPSASLPCCSLAVILLTLLQTAAAALGSWSASTAVDGAADPEGGRVVEGFEDDEEEPS